MTTDTTRLSAGQAVRAASTQEGRAHLAGAPQGGAGPGKAVGARRPAPPWTWLHVAPLRRQAGPRGSQQGPESHALASIPARGRGRGRGKAWPSGPSPHGRLSLGGWSLAAPSLSNVALSVCCTKIAEA